MAEDHTQNSTGSLAPVDKNVPVPKAVRQAAERANAAYGAQAEGQGTGSQQRTELTSEVSPGPQQGTAKPAPSEDAWQHRYESMKGRYDSAQQQLQSQANRITQLETLLSKPLPTVDNRATAQNYVPPELRPESLLTADEVRDYGEDFLNVVAKKATEVASPKLTQLERQVQELQAQLQGVGGHIAQTERQKLLNTLTELSPNWRAVNTAPDFLAWLRLPDPYSGATRQALLTQAFERNDAPRVAAFFNGFLAEEAAMDPAGTSQRGFEPVTQRTPRTSNGSNGASSSGKIPLETFAAPGRAKSAASQAGPAEKPIITSAQIASFYSDVRAGKYRGKDEEKSRLEAMIFSAQAEGRIRQ